MRWFRAHLNWFLFIGYVAAGIVGVIATILVEIFIKLADGNSDVVYPIENYMIAFFWFVSLIPIVYWYLHQKGRELLSILWWWLPLPFPIDMTILLFLSNKEEKNGFKSSVHRVVSGDVDVDKE